MSILEFVVFISLLIGRLNSSSLLTSIPSLLVVYNTSGLDGIFQKNLVKGVFAAFHDSNNGNKFHPQFLDIGAVNWNSHKLNRIPHSGIDHITIISLLSDNQLLAFSESILSKWTHKISIVTPRALNFQTKLNGRIRLTSLQMCQDTRIALILHRLRKEGIPTILPIIDYVRDGGKFQAEMLQKYKKLASRFAPNLTFLDALFLPPFSNISLNVLSNLNLTSNQGILLLTHQGPNQILSKHKPLNGMESYFRWFSHYEQFDALNLIGGNKNRHIFGPYSVQYVGDGKWHTPWRRQHLRQFVSFTGPNPAILSVALAYDSAIVAMAHFRNFSNNEILKGLSGDIQFNPRNGYRTQGTFFGISAHLKVPNKYATILQASNWILEDTIHVREDGENQIQIGTYQVATSSILSRDELHFLANRAKGEKKCESVDMEILAHDPFSQLPNRYNFQPKSIPLHILIPNQYGYGLTLRCHTTNSSDSLSNVLQIACALGDRNSETPIDCFKSSVRGRFKRGSRKRNFLDPRYIRNHHNRISDYTPSPPADDMTSFSYYQPYPYLNPSTYAYDSSTPATLTTRLDVPINEEPTHLPPTAGAAKLPELRQLLKAAKPFVGSCLGSTTGCAVCVLVLGRLPLGAVPAACTGPCFVGTFGTCGSLLGRVFAETTIICTELFRQGLIDIDTFLADAEFGHCLSQESPLTLLGYHVLATPIVNQMKESNYLTNLVAYFAIPWSENMKYMVGRSDKFNWKGYVVHTIGSWLCYVTGVLLNSFRGNLVSIGYSLGIMLTVVTVTYYNN